MQQKTFTFLKKNLLCLPKGIVMKIRHENLKAFLDCKKGAATAIAKRLEISKGMVSQWKTGTECVPEKYTEAICEVLGRPVEDLCQPFTGFRPELPDTEEMRMLAKVAPRLSDGGLNQVLLLALQLSQSETKQHHDS